MIKFFKKENMIAKFNPTRYETTYPYQQYEKWMELGKENFSLDTETLWLLTSFAACLVLQRLQYRAVRTNRSVL